MKAVGSFRSLNPDNLPMQRFRNDSRLAHSADTRPISQRYSSGNGHRSKFSFRISSSFITAKKLVTPAAVCINDCYANARMSVTNQKVIKAEYSPQVAETHSGPFCHTLAGPYGARRD